MPINRYLRPNFEDEISLALASDMIAKHHKDAKERKFFLELARLIDRSPFNVVLIDGVVDGGPLYPPFMNPKAWEFQDYRQYMLMPYSQKIEPVTPLVSVEFTRARVLEPSRFYPENPIKTRNWFRIDHGNSSFVVVERDKKGKLKAKADLDSLLDDRKLAEPPKTHTRMSSGQIQEIRDAILMYDGRYRLSLDIWDVEADFFELGRTSEGDLDTMKKFYEKESVCFADLSRLGIKH